jgi:hypothetical protein
LRAERASGLGRRGVSGTLAALTTIVIAAVVGPTGAGAAPSPSVNVGALRPVPCKPLPSDPPLEAPLYAQNAGASPIADGWWCQLPHATRMLASFVAVQRELIPLPDLYGLYSTTYGPPATTEAQSSRATQSSIVIAPEVNGAVTPGKIQRPPVPAGGRRVALAKGITATVVTKGRSVVVTWPYPSSNVPAYLRAVASITVTGTGVPESVVLEVAKHVKPD